MWQIGDRVSLKEEALTLPYLVGRHWYTNMYTGKKGRVIGTTACGSKMAIEFDDIVFTKWKEHRSSHDNGCHGKGKLHYCWYIPAEFLQAETCDEIYYLL